MVATSPSSGKVKQITADPRVTVLFADTARFNHASLHDRAQVATDEEKTSLWWDPLGCMTGPMHRPIPTMSSSR